MSLSDTDPTLTALPTVLQPIADDALLSHCGYVRAYQTLFVQFRHGGAIHAYFGVPAAEWRWMREHREKGTYLRSFIVSKFGAILISAGEAA